MEISLKFNGKIKRPEYEKTNITRDQLNVKVMNEFKT